MFLGDYALGFKKRVCLLFSRHRRSVNRYIGKIFFFSVLFSFLYPFASFCQYTSGFQYYKDLDDEAFSSLMLPKEHLLITLITHINDEIDLRRQEGASALEMGIDEVLTPSEKLVDSYSREMDNVFDLLEQVKVLEKEAKRHSDIEVLNAINVLKEEIKNMVGDQEEPHDALIRPSEEITESQASPDSTQAESDEALPEAPQEDLAYQLRFNRLLDHKMNRTKYTLLHVKLFQNGNNVHRERMFRRELKEALRVYSNGSFELARLLLKRLVNTYPGRVLDDVLFFTGETCFALNYLDEALAEYSHIFDHYPGSEFRAKAMIKVFNIHYIYRDFAKVYLAFEQLKSFRDQIEENIWNELIYLLGQAYYQENRFEETLTCFLQIDPDHQFYYPAKYLAATCTINLGNEQAAINLFEEIVTEIGDRPPNAVLGQIRNNSMLKIGLSLYENGKHNEAIQILDKISVESDYYDLSMMGKAWSAFQAGRPGEALLSAETLLSTNAVSNYVYEAKLLAASAKELLGNRDEALADLKQLYNTTRDDIPMVLSMDSEAETILSRTDPVLALSARSERLIKEVKRIQQFMLRSRKQTFDGSFGAEQTRADSVQFQLIFLDSLENAAHERRETETVSRIRELRSQLIRLVKNEADTQAELEIDSRDEKLILEMGATPYMRYLMGMTLGLVRDEKKRIKSRLGRLESQKTETEKQGKLDLTIKLEIEQEEMTDYLHKVNQYEVWLIENTPKSTQMDISKWANFSGYGISNITFSRIRDLDQRMATLSRTVQSLNNVIEVKQLAFESRIQGLLSDVANIEQQMLRDEKRKEMQEKEKYFQRQYFDKQPKETVDPSQEVTPVEQ